MIGLFNTIVYQPIFNGFVLLYNLIPDVGVVILIITVVIKLLLYPLTAASIKAQKSLSEMQPRLDELKAKFKDDKQALAQETMKMYKEHKVNPLGSCLPILVQLPIFIALYMVLQAGLASNNFEKLYSFVASPGQLNTVTLGIFDLKNSSIVLALLAGVAQFFQSKMFIRKKAPKVAGEGAKDENMTAMMNKQMLYFLPLMTAFIGMKMPAGLTLYWFLSTLLTVGQQMILFKESKNSSDSLPIIKQ